MRVVPKRASRTSCAFKVTVTTLEQDNEVDEQLNAQNQDQKRQIQGDASEPQWWDDPTKRPQRRVGDRLHELSYEE